MKNKLLLFTILLCSSFFNQTFGQDIHFKGCVNEDLTPSYTLSADGNVTDDEITRTTYKSDYGNYGEVITIKWNVTSDRWEIFHNDFDPNNEKFNDLLYFSSVATYPNPPNITIGNWANGNVYNCDPLDATHGELSGDVADTPPGINIDPTVTGLPSELTITEDAPPFVPPSGFDISSAVVGDVDLGAGEVTLTLDADGGRFSLAAGSPLILSGNGTSHITITGILFEVNNYINQSTNIYYTPESNLSGDNATSVDVYINDNGNTGTGGGDDLFVGSININITPVNDAPEVTVPASINIVRNIISPLTGISFSDVDAGTGEVTVDFVASEGELFATSNNGVISTGYGSTLSLRGTLSAINAFVANSNVTYLNDPSDLDYRSLDIAIDDNGNTGDGGNLSSSASRLLEFAPALAIVTSVSVPANDAYIEAENLDFIVNFDKSVNVNTGSGIPSLLLTVGSSSLDANYISGSGTSSLVFRYTVQVGDEDTDGVEVNTLTLNGGTITNDGVNATLALLNIGNTDNVLVDAGAPSGYAVSIDQDPIDASNESGVSFTFTGAEVGAVYYYTFSSSGGGTDVTGSGTITTTTDQISGIDLSGLNGGTIYLSVSLIDNTGQVGPLVRATTTKVINDPPIAIEDDFKADVNTPLTENVLTNDSDLNGDNLIASLVTAPVNGAVVLNADGGFTYTPNANYIGLDSLRYKVNDDGVPSLVDTTMVHLEVMDTAIPTGYSVSWVDDLINESESNATTINVSGATVGTTLNYTLSSSADGGAEAITGSSTILNASEDHIVDVSSLQDGTLTAEITLTSIYGTPGITASDNSAVLDQTAPSGYAVSIDQNPVDKTNQSAVSFTFSSSEVGDHFDYTFTSAEGSVEVTGSGIISSASQSISNIDLSNLADGAITLSVIMEDPAGNIGDPATATTVKTTNEVPTVSDVEVSGTPTIGEQLTGNYLYSDADGDTESGSTYKWYRSDNSSGLGKSEISGAVSQQYTLQEGDTGKYISFEVTPNDGITTGTAVESPLIGPAKTGQVINFPSIAEKNYGDAPFTLGDAQTDKDLTVLYSAADPSIVQITGNQATILKAGATTITATQVGDDQTNAAIPVQQTLVINQVTLTITAENATKVYGQDDPELSYAVTGFVNGDDQSMIEGSLSRAPGEDAGLYGITLGTLSAGSDYELQLETSEFEILKADQEIVWNQELNFGCDSQSQVTLLAESSSGLPITYMVADPSIGEVEGDVFTILESGVTTITAQQPGDQNYNPAVSMDMTATVSKSGLIRQHWDDVLVFDNSSGNFVSYQWYKNGSAIAGATKQYYSEGQTLNGSYYAVATTQNGKQITTCILEVSGESVSNKLMVVPNPVRATTEFAVEASFEQATLNEATISIIDLNGRLLQTIPVAGSKTMITAPAQTGIYVVIVNLSDGTRKTVNLLVQ